MLGTMTLRPLIAIFAFYDRTEKPMLSLWFPLQLCLYSVVLDFFFYVYHRSMHEYDSLWKLHKTHHRTKKPNAFLSAFADEIQELGDIVMIPVLTWLVLRYDFSTWFMCNMYSLWTEALGEFSGPKMKQSLNLRKVLTPTLPSDANRSHWHQTLLANTSFWAFLETVRC